MSIIHLFYQLLSEGFQKIFQGFIRPIVFFTCFLLFILLGNVIIGNFLIVRLLMQTVTVDVVCVVTFIVQTSYFSSFLLLGRWIFGIPGTSFCILTIPFIFSFSIIVADFFRCLIRWFCWSNPFTVTTIWKDTGILEEIIYFNLLFLLVGFFRRWWPFPFVFRRTSVWLKTRFCLVICDFYTSFCLLLFDWISVAFLRISCNQLNWIKCFIIVTSEMISFILNCFPDIFYSVRCSILLVVFGNLERLFLFLCVKNIFSLQYILRTFVLFCQLITAHAWCFWQNM